jgi:hypothetical protein
LENEHIKENDAKELFKFVDFEERSGSVGRKLTVDVSSSDIFYIRIEKDAVMEDQS